MRAFDETDSDSTLIAAIAAGDRGAFHIFARRHVEKSLAVAQRVLANAADAEEVVQDAFLRVWSHADTWRGGDAQVGTWLYRIVVNLAIDRVRRRHPAFAAIDEGDAVADTAPSAQNVIEGRELELQIAKEILDLPARQREALSLCYFDALNCAEAAHAMRISVSAMEALLVRARRTVRQRLSLLYAAAEHPNATCGRNTARPDAMAPLNGRRGAWA
jgi:RNA polymerase sigma-70 factor, ECF subfamily